MFCNIYYAKIFSIISLVTNLLMGVNSPECMSMINQKCMSRPKIIDVNTKDPIFYQYSIKVNKCSGTCNNINIPYGKICIPDIVKKN